MLKKEDPNNVAFIMIYLSHIYNVIFKIYIVKVFVNLEIISIFIGGQF